MEKRKKKLKKGIVTDIIVAFVCACATVIIIIFGWFFGSGRSQYSSEPLETIGTVTRVDELKVGDFVIISIPYVTYEAKGATYTTPISRLFDKAQVGDEYEMYYDYLEPYNADVKKSGLSGKFNFWFIVFAVPFVLLFLIPINNIKKKRLELKLIGETTPVRTVIIEKEVSEVRINGVHTHKIICRVLDFVPDMPMEFTSPTLIDEESLNVQIGDMLPVYVHPKNSKYFIMDFENVEAGKGMEEMYQSSN